MRYFEKNIARGMDLINMHDILMDATNVVASNLFFHEAKGGDNPNDRGNLARSAYNLIGVCEAIIDRVPEDEAARALAECRENLDPDEDESAREAAKMLASLIFGRL